MPDSFSDPKILGMISPLITILGSLVTLLTRIKDELKSIHQRLRAVGPFGGVFALSVVCPMRLYRLVASGLVLASLASIMFGVLWLEDVSLPAWFVSHFPYSYQDIVHYSYWEVLILVLLVACVYLSPLERGFLWVFSQWEGLRFGPDWINAQWHFSDGSDSPAINVAGDAILTLANTAFLAARTQKQSPLPGQAPEPHGLTQDELANYLLIACTIERCVWQLYRDFDLVKNSWAYLGAIAADTQRPFLPDTLRRYQDAKNSYYIFISSMGVPGQEREFSIPDAPEVGITLDWTVRHLMKSYEGCGSRLAAGFGRPTPRRLFRQLSHFKGFEGDSGEYYMRVYLKTAVRMAVWPDLEPGLFMYPFSANVALLMLNSGSLLASSETKSISTADKDFQHLCIGSEHQVVAAAFDYFRATKNDPETVAFSNAVFGKEPNKVKSWTFFDYLDTWLWSQAGRYCAKHSGGGPGAPECPLIPEGTTGCLCSSRDKSWRREGSKLVRD